MPLTRFSPTRRSSIAGCGSTRRARQPRPVRSRAYARRSSSAVDLWRRSAPPRGSANTRRKFCARSARGEETRDHSPTDGSSFGWLFPTQSVIARPLRKKKNARVSESRVGGALSDSLSRDSARPPLLEVQDLHVRFETSRGTVHAVDGISYNVNRGETVAIVGESGCGKSVSSLAIMRLLPANTARIPAGRILFEGRNLLALSDDDMRAVRGRDIAMIFQEPMTSLNPVLPIGLQIMEPLFIHLKMGEAQARTRALELLRLVGITDGERRLEQYPHHLSGGMRQRVMIAIGLACNPKLLIADEPTTALDVTIQAQILELMKDLSRRLHIALIIITHNLGVVARYADRVNVMYAARIIEQGTADDIFLRPRHPYTIGLMRSVPRLDMPRGQRLETIEGLPPDLRAPPAGCRFAPRCPFRVEACDQDPVLSGVGDGHRSACRRAGELAAGTLKPAPLPPKSAVLATASTTGVALLEVEGLHKYFEIKAAGAGFLSSKKATVKAVDDVSFTIAAGETLGLVGESGCGK